MSYRPLLFSGDVTPTTGGVCQHTYFLSCTSPPTVPRADGARITALRLDGDAYTTTAIVSQFPYLP